MLPEWLVGYPRPSMAPLADVVELSCPGCKRSLKQSRAVVVKRLEEGKPPRCAYCSKELTLPSDLKITRPAAAAQPPARVMGRCPLCLKSAMVRDAKNVEGSGALVGTCGACGGFYLCEGAGRGSIDVPASSPAAEEEVEAARPRLAALMGGRFLGDALLARAKRGGLEAGEAGHLVQLLEALARWAAPGQSPFLPLPPAEVLHLLGPIALGADSVSVDEKEGVVRLSSSEVFETPGLGTGSKVALNAVGIGLLLATGSGFTVRGRAPSSEVVTHEQVFIVDAVEGGSSLRAFVAQQGARPTPLDPAETAALAARLFDLRAKLGGYFRLLALYGTRFRGAAARRVTRESIVGRLHDLGVDARAVEAFIFAAS